ncbi:MAG: glycosyltransferase family 39 protein [Chloroflexota bacterium]
MKFINSIKQRWLSLDQSWKFAITAFLIARIFYALWSWVILTIQPIAVHYVVITGKPGVSFLNLYTVNAYTYVREVDGNLLTFRPINKDTVTDLQTGSIWNIYTGEAIRGNYKGIKLVAGILPSDMFPYHNVKPYPNAWLALWQRFDANWYTSIAENGYGNINGDDHFPPLYPLLIRLMQPIFGNAFIAGLVISHLATLYVLKLLYDLFNQWGNQISGNQTLLYFLIYPTSYYLFSAYTESLFLLLALLALRSMKQKSWAWAGFWVFCAITTRLQGAALLFPMLYLMWKDRPLFQNLHHWFSLAIAGSGFLFYIFLRSTQVSGNALPFAEPAWHAHLVLPWDTYLYAVRTLLSGNFNHIDLLNWAVVTLFLILLVLGWKKIPLEYSLYTSVSLLIMLIRIVESQPLISMSRYSLTLFPSFFILGLAGENPWRRRIILYTLIALNMYLSSEFFSWGWVA